MGVDGGSKSCGDIGGGLLWEGRVHRILWAVWRGSTFFMLEPSVVVDGSYSLHFKTKERGHTENYQHSCCSHIWC